MRFFCEEPTKCLHQITDIGYGFCYMSGCKGIGMYVYCLECAELLEYNLDYSSCSEKEIEWYENSQWKHRRAR